MHISLFYSFPFADKGKQQFDKQRRQVNQGICKQKGMVGHIYSRCKCVSHDWGWVVMARLKVQWMTHTHQSLSKGLIRSILHIWICIWPRAVRSLLSKYFPPLPQCASPPGAPALVWSPPLESWIVLCLLLTKRMWQNDAASLTRLTSACSFWSWDC